MINKVSILAGLLLLCMACAKENERKTPGGFKFTVVKKGDGKTIEAGKYLVLDLVFKDSKDSVWGDTRRDGFPIITQIQTPPATPEKSKEGVDAIFQTLFKGDSITFNIAAKELFEKTWRQPVPKNIDSTSFFTFFISAKDVLDEAGMQKLQQELVAKQNANYVKKQEEQLGFDIASIDNHLQVKGVEASKTSSGLRYVMTKSGKGKNAVSGQTVKINYAGFFLDGTLFDTCIESVAMSKNAFQPGRPYGPIELGVDRGEVIKGWDEIIKLMNKGSKLTVYIPSTLGYGAERKGDVIPANSILVFDMELVEIKK